MAEHHSLGRVVWHPVDSNWVGNALEGVAADNGILEEAVEGPEQLAGVPGPCNLEVLVAGSR